MVGLLLYAAPGRAGVRYSIFNPNDYSSLGELNPSSSIVIDTGDGSAAPTISIDGGAPLEGAVLTTQSYWDVKIAVFTFDTVTIMDLGDNLEVTGSLGLVLLSRGNLTVAGTTFDLSGGNAGLANGGAGGQPMLYGDPPGVGGPGAEGGTPGGSTKSWPPPDAAGDGGGSQTRPGHGVGAGQSRNDGRSGGGGGGYGGAGGEGDAPFDVDPGGGGAGGTPYGDAELTNLFGGSGGASGSSGNTSGAGGGGGGALELGAIGAITLVDVNLLLAGGNGSHNPDAQGGPGNGAHDGGGAGGSGGAILLHGYTISVQGTSTLDVSGADAGLGGVTPGGDERGGGGGGGGRIAFYSGDDFGLPGAQEEAKPDLSAALQTALILNGGTGVGAGFDGTSGTFYDGPVPRHCHYPSKN